MQKENNVKNNSSIAILLATYNSVVTLEQQIESILCQSFRDWTLFISDDGSTDSTLDIINSYIHKYKKRIFFIDNKQKRLGVSINFQTLLNTVDSRYYMFCDHDDVWLPNKIEVSMGAMKLLESCSPGKPILVHTDLVVVDQELQIINQSFYRYSKINPSKFCSFNFLGVANCITGCTMLINNPVKNLLQPIPDADFLYDRWIALNMSKNGIIKYLPEPTVLYRQHDLNFIGAKEVGVKYYFKILINLRQNIRIDIYNYKILKHINYGSVIKYICYKILFQIWRLIQ